MSGCSVEIRSETIGLTDEMENTFYQQTRKVAKKRADIVANARVRDELIIQPEGGIWATCLSGEIALSKLQHNARRKVLASSKLEIRFEQFFSDVFIGYIDLNKYERRSGQSSPKYGDESAGVTIVNMDTRHRLWIDESQPPQEWIAGHSCYVFLFKFGCVVVWDLPKSLRTDLIGLLEPYLVDSLTVGAQESDSMNYVIVDKGSTPPPPTAGTISASSWIKQDVIHLYTAQDSFERLSYSYAFAQSCKLSIFENNVEFAIESTRAIPETLAKTGTVNCSRQHISKMIGELFINRFYINLQSDILDTPDVFWDTPDIFTEKYSSTRLYLELPKRVDLLNQRLDIIKNLYDMLNEELSLQHGYKLEWIVIYLIVVEVIIEIFWNILIKDMLHLV